MSAGNKSAAKAMCSTSISDAQIDAAVTQLQSSGSLQSVMMLGVNVTSTNGSTQTMVAGSAVFSNGPPKKVRITFDHSGGNALIDDFRIR